MRPKRALFPSVWKTISSEGGRLLVDDENAKGEMETTPARLVMTGGGGGPKNRFPSDGNG